MVSIGDLLELTWLENYRFPKMTVFSAEMTVCHTKMTITSDKLSNDHFELTEVIVTEWIQEIHDKMNAMFLNNVRNIFDGVIISCDITVITIKNNGHFD